MAGERVLHASHRLGGAPFVAGIVYLLIESLEDALAERVLVRSGDLEAREASV